MIFATIKCSQQTCGMATLKDVAVRLRSVKNIQKITSSMKMVSASKFARAERDLRPARPYGKGAKGTHPLSSSTQKSSVLRVHGPGDN